MAVRAVAVGFLVCSFAAAQGAAAAGPAREFDIVVYGGTSGGVAAAVQASRMSRSVVLVEPGQHWGGLTAGGLGATDIGHKAAIGGVSREFYRRLGAHYAQRDAWPFQDPATYRGGRSVAAEPEMWTFEPHVAEQIFREMLREARVVVISGERLDLKRGVRVESGRIVEIVMESGAAFRGKVFIDAGYEGDLMAGAGVKYHVGREANAAYQETLNGVQLGSKAHQFKVPVDPYRVAGDPASGLLSGIHDGGPGEQGAGDHRVQAYNFRMCLTDLPENRLAFPKPPGYDPARYELLLRYIQAGVWDALGSNLPMPNRKTDTNNNGGFSTDNIGMNYDYPDGDYATRERIVREHIVYQQGLMWFLANDPRVPEKVRQEVNRWGLCRDEFTDAAGWSHQMYIREARRMISEYVMTQHNCQGRTTAADSVGLAAYGMDSHNTQRYVQAGRVVNEGDVQVHGFTPYPIAYRSIVPREAECSNLIVPVCLSTTHIAYGSIRMEPVFMVLGQSAATAASQAIAQNVPVQRIDLAQLQQQLRADKQILEWTGPAANAGRDPRKLPGLVVDDAAAELAGDWISSRSIAGYVGERYLHDGNAHKGELRARFNFTVARPGRYEVRLAYTPNANRAARVPVVVVDAAGDHGLVVNQQRPAPLDGFFSLGEFRFEKQGTVTMTNAGTEGHVIIDAVQVMPLDR